MAEEFKLVCLAESPSKKQRRAVGTYVRCELELNGKAMWEQAADKYRFIYYSLVNGGRWVIGSGAFSRGVLESKVQRGEQTKTTKGKEFLSADDADEWWQADWSEAELAVELPPGLAATQESAAPPPATAAPPPAYPSSVFPPAYGATPQMPTSGSLNNVWGKGARRGSWTTARPVTDGAVAAADVALAVPEDSAVRVSVGSVVLMGLPVEPHVENARLGGAAARQHTASAAGASSLCFQAALHTREEPWSHAARSPRPECVATRPPQSRFFLRFNTQVEPAWPSCDGAAVTPSVPVGLALPIEEPPMGRPVLNGGGSLNNVWSKGARRGSWRTGGAEVQAQAPPETAAAAAAAAAAAEVEVTAADLREADRLQLVCLADKPSKKQRRAAGFYVRSSELELNGKAAWENEADKCCGMLKPPSLEQHSAPKQP